MFPISRTGSHFPHSFTMIDLASQIVRMFLAFIQVSLVLSVFTVSSGALPSPLELIFSPLEVPASLETRATNTTSEQDLEVPILSYSPSCNPSYGRELNRTSCDNALTKISKVTTPMTFGQRGTGSYDVVLPRRYLSGTLSVEPSRLNS